MSSVALPSAASSSALHAESDLIRHAARGEEAAFGELYRRHSQTAWRLAQAVAADRDSALEAVRDGFARALKGHRKQRRFNGDDSAFRAILLAGVYRCALEGLQERIPTRVPTRGKAKNPEEALAGAAFRSLPERWRAAVWLSEVEDMDPARIATVLGVSVAVAAQLLARGRRGLAGRYAQAHQEEPAHIASLLRSQAQAVPANLAEASQARWASAGRESGPILVPLTAWLEERAVRPMWVAVGALFGLSLIGLGLVPGGTAVRGHLAAGGAASAGAIPISTGGTGGAAGGGSSANGTPGGGGSGPYNLFPSINTTVGGTTPGGTGYTPSSLTTSGSPGATRQPSTGRPGRGTGTGTGTGTVGGGGSGSGSTTTPATTTVVDLGPVASVTKTASTYEVSLLPSSSSSATASVSIGCSTGAGVTVGDATVGCSSDSTSTTTSTTSTTIPLATTVTKALTSTVTTLLPGL